MNIGRLARLVFFGSCVTWASIPVAFWNPTIALYILELVGIIELGGFVAWIAQLDAE